MRCDQCAHWLVARKTLYEDGSEIVNFHAAEGKGLCEILKLETTPSFGCTAFLDGGAYAHMVIGQKSGAPWQYSKSGPCPDCSSQGASGDRACHRCAGTGKVRHYEDGFIGEERTRLHPKEKEGAPKPKCISCGAGVEINWKACPQCGNRLEPPAEVEKIDDVLAGVPAPDHAEGAGE